jgi:hypothetical protein
MSFSGRITADFGNGVQAVRNMGKVLGAGAVLPEIVLQLRHVPTPAMVWSAQNHAGARIGKQIGEPA